MEDHITKWVSSEAGSASTIFQFLILIFASNCCISISVLSVNAVVPKQYYCSFVLLFWIVVLNYSLSFCLFCPLAMGKAIHLGYTLK